jgi:hypothetical protein
VSWWITRAERTLTEEVPGAADQVRNFYLDLNNIRLVHPLVVSVHTTSRRETPGGYEQTYRVWDRIPLGPLTIRTSYLARLQVPVSGDVIAEAHQFPRVRLHSVVSFEHTDRGTHVIERMRMEAPRPLAAVTVREAVKAHIAMLAGIRSTFEGRQNPEPCTS